MKALTCCAPYKVSVENVPDPKILNRRDAIVRVTSTCICGSDLHLYDGYVPFMKPGDILGHEPMGIVEELGPDVDKSKLKVGDRVVVPFPIACGGCGPAGQFAIRSAFLRAAEKVIALADEGRVPNACRWPATPAL